MRKQREYAYKALNVVAHVVYPVPSPSSCHRLLPFSDLESGFGRSVNDEPIHLLTLLW